MKRRLTVAFLLLALAVTSLWWLRSERSERLETTAPTRWLRSERSERLETTLRDAHSVRSSGTAPHLPALDVLHAWDHERARAYARGDPAALRALYVPGSVAGVRDVRTLRGYLRRGFRVEGLRMQLLAVRVLARRHGLWRLGVTDRVGHAVAVGHGTVVPLPRDSTSTRTVTLVRRSGEWRVRSVVSGGGV
jgi:hypothetical protein